MISLNAITDKPQPDGTYQSSISYLMELVDMHEILSKNEIGWNKKFMTISGEVFRPWHPTLATAYWLNKDLGLLDIPPTLVNIVKGLLHLRNKNAALRRYSGEGRYPSNFNLKKINVENRFKTGGLWWFTADTIQYARFENKLKTGKKFADFDGNIHELTEKEVCSSMVKGFSEQRPRPFAAKSGINKAFSMLYALTKGFLDPVSAYSNNMGGPFADEWFQSLKVNTINGNFSVAMFDKEATERSITKEMRSKVAYLWLESAIDILDLSEYANFLMQRMEILLNEKLIIRENDKADCREKLVNFNFLDSGFFLTNFLNSVIITVELIDLLGLERVVEKNGYDKEFLISKEFYKLFSFNIRTFGDNVICYGETNAVNKFKNAILAYKPKYSYSHGTYATADTFLGYVFDKFGFRSTLISFVERAYSPEKSVMAKDKLGYYKPNLRAGYMARRENAAAIAARYHNHAPWINNLLTLDLRLGANLIRSNGVEDRDDLMYLEESRGIDLPDTYYLKFNIKQIKSSLVEATKYKNEIEMYAILETLIEKGDEHGGEVESP